MRKDQRSFDHIFQLTDIAGPRMAYQPFERFWINLLARPLEFHAVLFEEILRQERNIIETIP